MTLASQRGTKRYAAYTINGMLLFESNQLQDMIDAVWLWIEHGAKPYLGYVHDHKTSTTATYHIKGGTLYGIPHSTYDDVIAWHKMQFRNSKTPQQGPC